MTRSSVRVLLPLLPPTRKASGFADGFVFAATAMSPFTGAELRMPRKVLELHCSGNSHFGEDSLELRRQAPHRLLAAARYSL
jgi:hypothetical protein